MARAGVAADASDDEMPPLAEPPTRRTAQPLVAQMSTSSDLAGLEGDVLLLLDLPEGSTVGIDTKSFIAKGSEFLGFKAVPEGVHLIWWSAPGGMSVRSGVWIATGKSKHAVHVLRWSRFEETFTETSPDEADDEMQNLPSKWEKLLDYSQVMNTRDEDDMWMKLSAHINRLLLIQVAGEHDSMWPISTTDHVEGESQTGAEIELDKQLSSHPRSQQRDLAFSFGQRVKSYATDLEGRDRTIEAIDASGFVSRVQKENESRDLNLNFVGEVQFALLTGVHLGNEACLQQWWHTILYVVLKAYILQATQPSLVAALLRTLDAQITYTVLWLETSFITESNTKARELRLALTVYKRRLGDFLSGCGDDATLAQQLVGTAFASLEETVETHLEWDISGEYLRRGRVVAEDGEELELEVTDLEAEDERGEFAPEVVELDDEGRQKDLLSWDR